MTPKNSTTSNTTPLKLQVVEEDSPNYSLPESPFMERPAPLDAATHAALHHACAVVFNGEPPEIDRSITTKKRSQSAQKVHSGQTQLESKRIDTLKQEAPN